MFCEKCGCKLQDDDRFCPDCGNPVVPREDKADPAESAAPSYEERKLEPDYDSQVTRGMGYGYRSVGGEPRGKDPNPYEHSRMRKEDERELAQKQQDDFDEEWEREERKEKITFIVLGVIILGLIIAIAVGVIMLFRSDSQEEKRTPQLNEAMKEEMEQQQKAAAVTPEVTETPTPEPTQEAVPEVTEAPVQEVTPEPTPEATPIPTVPPAATPVPTAPPAAQPAAPSSSDFIIPDSSTRYLSNADLTPLSEWQIRIARNEIYARHGRIFKSGELNDYFRSKSWYTPSVPPENFDNSYLNSIEIENLKLITEYEKVHGLNQ